MIEKSTLQKVLSVFFENPSTEYYLRELSRKLKLSMPTIVSTTDNLSRKKLILKTKGKALTKVIGNRGNNSFIVHKRIYNLEMIYDSEIVDYLSKAYNYPKNIVLFGSFSRGEDVENSDIDIAITTKKHVSLSLEEYEKRLRRDISIHEIDLDKVSGEFKANLINGIIVEGTW